MQDNAKRPLIQSISRAISILQCFGNEQELGLTEISQMVGLHKSTTAGIIHTLKAERFLEQNEQTGKMRLGSALFSLTINTRSNLEDICMPYLQALLKETGETVNLAIRDGSEVVYISKEESLHSVRISTSVGMRMPMYCTAIGKAIMANLDEKTVDQIIAATDFVPLTDKTIINGEQLRLALDTIRSEGIAYDFEEFAYGLICMAAPIFRTGRKPMGAISVSGPSVRMNETAREEIARKVLETAEGISSDLSRIY